MRSNDFMKLKINERVKSPFSNRIVHRPDKQTKQPEHSRKSMEKEKKSKRKIKKKNQKSPISIRLPYAIPSIQSKPIPAATTK